MALNGVFQRPYTVRDNRQLVKKRGDEDNSTAQTSREEQGNQNSKSKGLQYVEPQKTNISYPKTEDKPSWQETRALIQNQAHNRIQSQQGNLAGGNSVSAAPSASASPYANVSSNINIAQILKDFKNTQAAIGTPDNLKEEVAGYLDLIEKQVVKDNPNKKLIKSNLKNAASILDNYISETLNKESKVVENWVDALFLQQIDFKYNDNDINPQFLVKFPEGSVQQESKVEDKAVVNESTKETLTEAENPKVASIVPRDKTLKTMFIQAKKFVYANEPEKAITSFGQALKRANEVGDNETISKIYFEVGKIYDNHDYYAQALKSYNKALDTDDNNLKTKAHFSMAQIYDDTNQIKPALDHYFVSISYAGESDNPVAQSTSLTKMGNIYTDMYEQDAFDYYDTAQDLAAQTDNSKVKGYISSSLANAYNKFGEPQEALKSYYNAVQHYTDAESPLKAAQNFAGAADIMVEYGNISKAKGLLKKAQNLARQTDDINLMNEISSKLASLV